MVSPAGDEDDDEHMQNMFVAMPLLACYLYLAASYNNNRIYYMPAASAPRHETAAIRESLSFPCLFYLSFEQFSMITSCDFPFFSLAFLIPFNEPGQKLGLATADSLTLTI